MGSEVSQELSPSTSFTMLLREPSRKVLEWREHVQKLSLVFYLFHNVLYCGLVCRDSQSVHHHNFFQNLWRWSLSCPATNRENQLLESILKKSGPIYCIKIKEFHVIWYPSGESPCICVLISGIDTMPFFRYNHIICIIDWQEQIHMQNLADKIRI